uniref:RING-type E3 ubiquitin transferase n=1 Tax=Chromera velia CCMP2878 TaxID=1169474 RepID=A0A0G4I5E5_9ALVE|eukprot:Cvel_11148.t1-p1 / transcript=Cvel_11148.t1 / gene=Cvel_11148 / organism=Chromera_velia_CCMP2878 / gene_product=Probable E3 ubiquitin-protein ligase DTX3, putative / transcript_product=Probable E3 ubiquitin-protein ligase DTX3, putative / location=Cvel_scaffold691:46558-49897(+) / protein_length=546 / sequence_SO=supercontig / SO=protein_coding / is_pseudo=false
MTTSQQSIGSSSEDSRRGPPPAAEPFSPSRTRSSSRAPAGSVAAPRARTMPAAILLTPNKEPLWWGRVTCSGEGEELNDETVSKCFVDSQPPAAHRNCPICLDTLNIWMNKTGVPPVSEKKCEEENIQKTEEGKDHLVEGRGVSSASTRESFSVSASRAGSVCSPPDGECDDEERGGGGVEEETELDDEVPTDEGVRRHPLPLSESFRSLPSLTRSMGLSAGCSPCPSPSLLVHQQEGTDTRMALFCSPAPSEAGEAESPVELEETVTDGEKGGPTQRDSASPCGSVRAPISAGPVVMDADGCVVPEDEVDEDELVVKLEKCGHFFHRACVLDSARHSKGGFFCPVCKVLQLQGKGASPAGVMSWSVYPSGESAIVCEGHEDEETVVINYEMPSGIQGPHHPSPGVPYRGTQRFSFFPHNVEGKVVLRLLTEAFEQGHTFSVGTSLTTGQKNVITWGGIHHKTRPNGGVAHHGWPDPGFFLRCLEELEAKGIKPNETELKALHAHWSEKFKNDTGSTELTVNGQTPPTVALQRIVARSRSWGVGGE